MKSGEWDWKRSESEPIIVGPKGEVMAGHHRVVAAERAKLEVPSSAIRRFDGNVERVPSRWEEMVWKKRKKE